MRTTGADGPSTLLEAIRSSLEGAAKFNPNDATRPAAILWADPDKQWEPIISPLRKLMPQLLTLGEYAPEQRTGPTIWIRCAIERALPDVEIPADIVPVIYLPGVSRQSLRAGQECPDELKPIVELQYRGAAWTQRNGKDWTVEAFLMSDDGVGLDVARDAATRRALHSVLAELITTPLTKLRGKHLEAEDFDKLLTEDTVKDLLVWLNDPAGSRKEWPTAKWRAFQSRCKAEFAFDPEKDGELVGGELLGTHQGKWSATWERFKESPVLYPGIAELLRKAIPARMDMFADAEPWPQRNEEMETALRTALGGLKNADAATARKAMDRLESEHAQRREWVWAKLGWAPLAESLIHLKALADLTATHLGGASAEEMAAAYVESGFRADLAVLDALASVRTAADLDAVGVAVHSVYLPWLEHAAEHFQKVCDGGNAPKTADVVTVELGGLVLFSDGLRFDVANRLAEQMRARGWTVALGRRWAAIPSVTATGKAAVAPVAADLGGNKIAEDFAPYVANTTQAVTADRLRKLLESRGYQYVANGEVGDPAGRGWSEYGDLDNLGHSLDVKLAARVGEQIDLLIERLQVLFDSGWKEVRIVTDHGWLLVPGGLPKVDLPRYLTQSRWARCATIKGNAKVEVPMVRWHWNADERVAVAPGVHCFAQGYEYAHGGLSLQECLIPDIRVSIGKDAGTVAFAIEMAKWRGLRCDVQVRPVQLGVVVELRTKVNDGATRVAEPKKLNDKGTASLLVVDDELEGTPAIVVVLDGAGHVVSKQPTIIGGDDA